MMFVMRILITGGTGFIGRTLIERLKHSHKIVAMTRRDTSLLDPDVEWIKWENKQIQKLPPVDGVIHLMGENIAEGRWTKKKKKAIFDSRVQGTRYLISSLKENSIAPEFFISTSAIGIYPKGDDLNESTPPGDGFLSSVCQKWEQELASLSCPRKLIVRIGVVLGDDGGMMKRVLPVFKWGLGGVLGSGDQWMSWIHKEDLLRIFQEAVDSDLSGVLNAVSPNPVTNREFTRELSRILSRPAWFFVPAFSLKLLMGEMSCIVLDSQRVSPSVLQKRNFSYRYPSLTEAMRQITGRSS